MAKPKTQAIAKKEPAAAAVALWEADAGEGFEGTTADDFAIPFLVLLQKMSPQCDPDAGAHVPGAAAGMFYDAGTGEVLEEVRVVPCHYHRAMVKWRPDRGGFAGQEEPGYEAGLPRKKRDDGSEAGVWVDAEGNEVADTRYFFVLRLTDDGDALPVILSFTSTQTKKARTWLTRMQAIKATGPNGKFTPPMYAHVWRLTSVPEQNEQGTWRGYKVDVEGPITDADLFRTAKEAREMFKQADRRVKPPEPAGGGEPATTAVDGPNDEIPF